jgi:hypothetical protein
LAKAISSSDYYFVLFTVDACPQCEAFYDVFRQAADMISVGSPGMTGVPVAKVDLTNETTFMKE